MALSTLVKHKVIRRRCRISRSNCHVMCIHAVATVVYGF